MGDETVLKGVFKDGGLVASVIQKPEIARILVKGAEPGPDFKEAVRKVADGCKPHVEKFSERELCAVLVANPGQAESIDFTQDEIGGYGLTKITAMDGTCGIVVRVVEAEPAPIPLAYTSLRSSSGLPDQPGMADVPAALPRKAHKDLNDSQKKVYEAAAQVAGRGLIRMICIDDGGLKLVVSVKDAPPPRARTVLVPLGQYADELASGLSFEDLVKKLAQLRT
ncbi:MAG TPA: hypothetical protein VM222_05995 [Planctomycetota bacterium]|nr:hypothetical protein [Planctomycetota bacterium]